MKFNHAYMDDYYNPGDKGKKEATERVLVGVEFGLLRTSKVSDKEMSQQPLLKAKVVLESSLESMNGEQDIGDKVNL